MKQEHVISFEAIDDHGNRYSLQVWQDIADASTRNNPSGTKRGLKTLMTADGRKLNYRAKGEYELNGMILRSSDPDAP